MAPKKKGPETCANPDDDTLLYATRAQWLADNAKANEINAKILAGLLAPALLYLQNLDSFKDWDAPQPLQLKTKDEKSQGHLGAYMAPFDKKACLQSLDNSGKYICAVPLPYLNLQYSPTPGVRLSKGQIEEAVEDDDFTYKVWPMQKIAVSSDEDKFTNLTPISPEEPRIAHLVNFVERHKKGKVSLDQELDFKRNIWCLPCQFYVCDSLMKRFFDAIAERRDTVKLCRMVKRSASQTVEEIISTANRIGGGKCTAQKIFEAYKKRRHSRQ